MPDRPLPRQALVDVVDRLPDTGVVPDGQRVSALAGVDLMHGGLRALLASLDTTARVADPGRFLPRARPIASSSIRRASGRTSPASS